MFPPLGHAPRGSRRKIRSPDWFRLGPALSVVAGVLGIVLLLIVARAHQAPRAQNDDAVPRYATLSPVATSPPDQAATPVVGVAVGISPSPTVLAPSATPSPWTIFLPDVAVSRGNVARKPKPAATPTVTKTPTPLPPTPVAPTSPPPRPIISRATPIPVPGNPNQVVVPDLVGLPEAVAQRVINESGLMTTYVNYQTIDQVADHQFFQSIPPGAVLSQAPPAGTRVSRGTRIALAVRRR